MSRHTRFPAALLTVLLMLTVCTSLTVFASHEDGEAPQESVAEQQNDNSAAGGAGGNTDQRDNDNDDGDEEPQQDDGGSHSRYEDDGRYEEDDYDDSYQDNQDNQNNQNNQSNSRDRDTENESVMYVYYDSDGNEYSNPEDMYVGGDQTYVPPVSTPSTTAALYDTTHTRVDENTLSNGDWADISRKLRSANAAPGSDTGDFAFIQKNTDTGDNGHWMLILGFTLITLGIVGFIYLIAKAGSRKRALAESYAADPAHAAQQPRTPRYRKDEGYGDDFDNSGKEQ